MKEKQKPVKYEQEEIVSVRVQEVGAFEAKTHLSSILQKVAHGETFYVTKHGKPIAEIRPIAAPAKKIRVLGKGRGKGWMAPDFDAPLEDFKDYM